MNRRKKWMMLIGTAGMLSMAVYGCKGTEAEPEIRQEESEADSAKTARQTGAADSDAQAEETGDASEESKGETEQSSSAMEELAGDILEIGTMQFTVNKITQMTDEESGAEIMVIGAPGNEQDMERITVTYDENTKFYKRTIRNGGADYEDTDASPDDLEKEMTAEMKGSYEGDAFHASEIQLVEVILQ